MKSQLYTYLSREGHLVLPLSVAEFNGPCTQFEEKPTMHFDNIVWTPNPTSNMWKDASYCLHRLQSSTRSVHNSRKNQLYTYLACKNRPSHFYMLWFLSNARS